MTDNPASPKRDGRSHLPKAKEKCPTCKGTLEIDIEPFEGTVLYCRRCQKNVKLFPIQPPRPE